VRFQRQATSIGARIQPRQENLESSKTANPRPSNIPSRDRSPLTLAFMIDAAAGQRGFWKNRTGSRWIFRINTLGPRGYGVGFQLDACEFLRISTAPCRVSKKALNAVKINSGTGACARTFPGLGGGSRSVSVHRSSGYSALCRGFKCDRTSLCQEVGRKAMTAHRRVRTQAVGQKSGTAIEASKSGRDSLPCALIGTGNHMGFWRRRP